MVRLLATTEPVDFDARLEEWRSAGWNGIYAQRDTYEPQRTAQPGHAAREPGSGLGHHDRRRPQPRTW